MQSAMQSATEQAAVLAARARRICVLTGAGISTDSGIPDFRGPNGVWTRDPGAQRFVDFRAYQADAELRAASWQRRAAHPAFAAEPNAGHRSLGALHEQGRLHAVLTQNIDGLHQRAGVPARQVLELHGTLHESECLGCGARLPMEQTLARVRAGELDPPCTDCGSMLKSATIFFGQPLDATVFQAAVTAVRTCDLLVAVGTSLTVQPVAGLVDVAARAGAPIVIVNAMATPYDELAEIIVREPIGAALPAIFERVDRPGTATFVG
jgi:NAD-dependent deacetylase